MTATVPERKPERENHQKGLRALKRISVKMYLLLVLGCEEIKPVLIKSLN